MRDAERTDAPAIYYFQPLLAGPLEEWDRHLDRCREMGFTHLLMAPPFQPGRGGNIFLTADHDKPHPALGRDLPAETILGEIAEQCASRGLTLWLDLVLDRVAAEAPVVRENPTWFQAAPSDELPDPRQLFPKNRASVFRFDAESEAPIAEWWGRRIADWLRAGVRGFRLDRPHMLPSGFLQQVP
jgi:starch synthase (maltosyl-transferring)